MKTDDQASNQTSSAEKSHLRYQREPLNKNVKSLTVIDNGPLRQFEIKNAKAWFRKIDQLEKSIFTFQETDQKLFGDWHSLTFRSLQNEIQHRTEEFKKLAEFHNQIVFLSIKKKISNVQAYKILAAEELRFVQGDDDERESIKAERQKRLDELFEMQTQKNSCDCAACRLEREFQDSEAMDEEDDWLFEDSPIDDESFSILELSVDEIKLKLKNFDSGMNFLLESAMVLMRGGKVKKLKEIWSLTPLALKKAFNMLAEQQSGQSFDKILQGLEHEAQNQSPDFTQEDIDSEEDSFDFKSETFQGSHKVDDNHLIEVTSIYRKIVRKIHPDHIDPQILKKKKLWFDQVWKQSLEAKERYDLPQLKLLHYKITASFQEYHELSLFELKELSISMSTELGSIKQQAKDLRSHPAWKFSSKKDLSALERKMQKPFLDQLNRLNEDISEMLFVREQMKQRSAQPEPPMKRRKSSQRKTAKSKGFNHQQMSFGDL